MTISTRGSDSKQWRIYNENLVTNRIRSTITVKPPESRERMYPENYPILLECLLLIIAYYQILSKK